jgi:hypothetical protein
MNQRRLTDEEVVCVYDAVRRSMAMFRGSCWFSKGGGPVDAL